MEAWFWRALDAPKIQAQQLMTMATYKKICLVILAAWIAIWLNFLIRDFTKGGYLKDYKALLSRDAEGKASYTYGDRFFEFLKFCNSALPEGASYGL
jgi:hypothetical protein